MTDKDVERVAAEIEQVFAADPICSGLFCASTVEAAARVAIAAYESAVTEIAKLGTVSLTSFDGHCVRIDFPNREDAERMYAVLTKGSE
jgi:hypothetical protein